MHFLSLKLLSILLWLVTIASAGQTATITVLDKLASPTTTSKSDVASTQILSTPPPTSVVQATQSQGGYISASAPVYSNAAGGGASGSDNTSFDLSTGGMIAIIVVVIFVVIFGVASTVLWVIAKRRQWNIRDSIKHVSRRLTGRGQSNSRSAADRRKRSGMVATQKKSGTKVAYPPGQPRGVVVAVEDVEKGKPEVNVSEQKEHVTWSERLRGNHWK